MGFGQEKLECVRVGADSCPSGSGRYTGSSLAGGPLVSAAGEGLCSFRPLPGKSAAACSREAGVRRPGPRLQTARRILSASKSRDVSERVERTASPPLGSPPPPSRSLLGRGPLLARVSPGTVLRPEGSKGRGCRGAARLCLRPSSPRGRGDSGAVNPL